MMMKTILENLVTREKMKINAEIKKKDIEKAMVEKFYGFLSPEDRNIMEETLNNTYYTTIFNNDIFIFIKDIISTKGVEKLYLSEDTVSSKEEDILNNNGKRYKIHIVLKNDDTIKEVIVYDRYSFLAAMRNYVSEGTRERCVLVVRKDNIGN